MLAEEQVEKSRAMPSCLKENPTIRVDARAYKMSKSRGNVINPDDVVSEYGADSLRLYEMFMGPLEATKPWSMRGVEGVYRFLSRVWRLIIDDRAEEMQAGRRGAGRAAGRGDAAQAAPDDPEGDRRPGRHAFQHRHRRHDGVHQPSDAAGRCGRGRCWNRSCCC